jgi:hypothetical protein
VGGCVGSGPDRAAVLGRARLVSSDEKRWAQDWMDGWMVVPSPLHPWGEKRAGDRGSRGWSWWWRGGRRIDNNLETPPASGGRRRCRGDWKSPWMGGLRLLSIGGASMSEKGGGSEREGTGDLRERGRGISLLQGRRWPACPWSGQSDRHESSREWLMTVEDPFPGRANTWPSPAGILNDTARGHSACDGLRGFTGGVESLNNPLPRNCSQCRGGLTQWLGSI